MAKIKFLTGDERKTQEFVKSRAEQGLSAKKIAIKFKKRFGIKLDYGREFANETVRRLVEKDTIEVDCKE